ncbi:MULTISPECIES: dihydrodipicolinate synthase family protein [unclassified Rhizobium]|uniref:dihydrodipicolinate synthase family protein n=1 Tax=unclassified Rhizobium TaxID=2613769 RepID=UPI001C836A29|nr:MULTISPECIES: dihydrodipicolinate synthase family protein [unclassified Rhizobium]MBX5160675.1 dihydrodipicolinate synthase family protein [Rhizobium sp. NZLR8]MBX5167596.1 dihydrodipicolinate synthase family protein [Rhizobium sp. NZLR4b]MBX5186204.1 dihydrodipicolinate synthase family protein [Rhizobium sp. NZLR5]MBX5191870.1 dihydrodipicolinate synthase family protein [Rhizobium sp. NZLR3b]MBX5199416.1 dihydrodipicolinate synthase family protein [Rhizobium sp. NZLR10]
MTAFPFPGLNLAITTPFDDAGRIDYGRLEVNVERYLAAGVRSFLFSSGTGMHVYLSKQESEELIARGVKLVNGRAKVIAQTSALLVEDVVERTARARDAGAEGVMVLPPFFEGPTDDQGILDFYAEVAKAGLPVIGYNVPQTVGVAITPELLNRLNEIPGFCAVKDSSGDLGKQAALIRTGRFVMNGADPLVPYALYAGCDGLIWGGANFAPRTSVALVEAAAQCKWDEVRALWKILEPSMGLIWEGDYVQSVYVAAELIGYGAGAPRKPLRALDPEKLPALRRSLEMLMEREAI